MEFSMRSGVLFVSPHVDDAHRLSQMLSDLPLSFEHAQDLGQARTKLQDNTYGVILTEAALPDGAWLDVLDLARQMAPDSEVIVTKPLADARFWAEALNLGAYDLLVQPFATSEVQRIVGNACTRVLPQKTTHAAV
jgi:DNA-binding NtrC family response regulator